MTAVKICGITRMQDAQHAVACGAEMLGFNFYRQSSRYIDPSTARAIVASVPSSVECVGVFVNESPEDIRSMIHMSGVRSVQLHGDESPEVCDALAEFHPIKAVRAGDSSSLAAFVAHGGARILLDTPSPELGGTGKTFDWKFVREVRAQVPFLIVAGGLDPDNVGRAIRETAADAVDACSRLESSPGIKDPKKVARFVAIAHRTVNTASLAEGK